MSFRSLKLISIICVMGVCSCKYRPNQTRSTIKSKDVYQYVEKGSIDFTRASGRTKGDLTFSLKDQYNCSVQYWTEDLDIFPNESSPKTIPCPSGQLSMTIPFSELERTTPYTFKILIWPKNLTTANAAFIVIIESEDIRELETKHIIFHNFNSPRQAGEIYTFLQDKAVNIVDLRENLHEKYPVKDGVICQSKPVEAQYLYYRNYSIGDPEKRPLHGLSSIATAGYGFTKAKPHAFYDTRLISKYNAINRLQNWTWQFQWEGITSGFTTYPPSYIEDLEINNSGKTFKLSNRDLQGVLPVYEFGQESPEIKLSAIYPGEINFVHIDIKDPYDPQKSLNCTYVYDGNPFTVPIEAYQTLGPGTYDITVILESIDIHFKSDLPYPPWVFSSQDWVHAKIKKVI